MESNHQKAERCAAEWITRREGALWSKNDEAALECWLDESPVHAVAFIRLEAAWRKADRYKALGAGFPPDQIPTPVQLNQSPFFDEPASSSARSRSSSIETLIDEQEPSHASDRQDPRRWFPFAIAASLLALLTLGRPWGFWTQNQTFTTPVGGVASVPMQDGSQVTLNTNSEVRVAVTATQRFVRLERGEVFFDVIRDPKRPFVVDAGGKRVIVLGTAFSVRRNGGDIQVSVTEGKVRLEDTAPPLGIANGNSRPRHESTSGAFVLNAGGVASAGRRGVLVQSKPLSEVQDTLSWRSGFVVFRDVDLAAAVAEFNRYNERRILIEDPALAAIRLSGKFKATNFDAFVRLLEDGYPIAAHEVGTGILLARRVK